MIYDARQIANFLLDYAAEKRMSITNMALLKHIYFAHGWHLASKNAPLISNRIEAWEHGPVIRAVYDSFKRHGGGPINTRAEITNWSTGDVYAAQANFNAELEFFIVSTFDYYARFDAFELSTMTHESGSPWDEIWNASDGKVQLNMEIPNKLILRYFATRGKLANVQ